jgi:3'-phosphoadenosine 5'-phosphosulfate sulfotransferase (PAPS reductase)/FAD synthetase
MTQLSLLTLPPPEAPDLADYDWILLNSSAGKDSQAMIDLVAGLANAAGLTDRLIVVHADLGRVEWPGARELAERQAAHYGLRFVAVARPQGDLLTHVEQRGMWPSPSCRYCTSDHKRAQVHRVMTSLPRPEGRPVRILNCLGLRADESPARRKRPSFTRGVRPTNGNKIVDEWLPVHGLTEAEVWARIRASGAPHHPAYELEMPRLSCCFCIFAPRAALVLAGRHNLTLLREYVGVEERTGHDFRPDLALRDVLSAVESGEDPGPVTTWSM